jgi:hypothetical protein
LLSINVPWLERKRFGSEKRRPMEGRMPLIPPERLEQALQGPDAVGELRRLASELLASGCARERLLEEFDHARLQFRAAGREADEDAVADVLDFLVGWCSPPMRL